MDTHFRKTVIWQPFDAVLDQLMTELRKAGFEIGGITDFHRPLTKPSGATHGNYKVLAVYIPFLYQEMMTLSPFEGIVMPCNISMVELNTRKTAIIPYNVTAQIVRGIQNPSLENLSAEVTRRLELAVHALEREETPINSAI